MAKTFLELVNDAVYESKVVLDPLTALNFASPPRTSLYDRFKRWVNQSYLELLNEKPEWFYTSKRTVVTIRPRLKLAGLTHGTAIATVQVGDILRGQESGVLMTVMRVDTTTEPADVTNNAVTVDVDYDPSTNQNDLILNEKFDLRRPPSPTFTVDWGRIGGRGRYNFKEAVSTLDDLIEGSISIQPAVDVATNPSPTDLQPVWPVNFLPWDKWAMRFDYFATPGGRPIVITQAPDGNFEFYPQPDGMYDVSFTYSQKGVAMVAPTDLPVLLPEKYHDYLVWRTIGELADFNNDQALYARAKKKWDRYYFWMMRDMMPKPSLDLSRFDLYPEGTFYG